MTVDSNRKAIRKLIGCLCTKVASLLPSPSYSRHSGTTSTSSSSENKYVGRCCCHRTSTSSGTSFCSLMSAPASDGAAISLELWTEAYEGLRYDPNKVGLVLAYESVISQELPYHLKAGGGMAMDFGDCSNGQRLTLLAEIARAGLAKRRQSSRIGDEDEGRSDDDHVSPARATIYAAKEAIDAVVPEYMSAVVAWAGICTMTPLLLDPLFRLAYLSTGMTHVLGRIDLYMNLALLLLPGSWRQQTSFLSEQQAVSGGIVRHYRRLLEFEMNCVCAAASAWNPAARNVVGWGGLPALVRAIENADRDFVELIETRMTDMVRYQLVKGNEDLEL